MFLLLVLFLVLVVDFVACCQPGFLAVVDLYGGMISIWWAVVSCSSCVGVCGCPASGKGRIVVVVVVHVVVSVPKRQVIDVGGAPVSPGGDVVYVAQAGGNSTAGIGADEFLGDQRYFV